MTFISDPGQLQAGLFAPYQSRYGAQTSLNINLIPDLLQHIKRQLTSQELIRLEDYHLQNYLMELSIAYKQSQSLSAITGTVLTHIRSNNNFWYRHNNKEQLDQEQQLKHHAIVCYQKDIQCLKQTFSNLQNHFPFIPQYQRKTTQTYQFQLLHNNSEPYFGTRQPLNHLAFIPLFLIHKKQQLIRQNSLKESQGNDIVITQEFGQDKSKLNSSPDISDNDKQKEIMEECITFLMSNKSRNTYTMKQSRKEISDEVEAEEQIQKSSSESENNESISQQQTILDEFLSFVEHLPTLPKFPNSHHMQFLTLNIINSCKKVLTLLLSPKEMQKIKLNERQMGIQQASSLIKLIQLDQKLVQTLSMISQKVLSEGELDIIGLQFLKNWQKGLKVITRQMRNRQLSSLDMKGWLNTPQEIQKIKESYQNMLDHPQFVQLTKYRAMGTGIPWKEADYLKFLKGLKDFLNIPTNNKKIASSMGEGYEPNHVKHVKGVYLTVMKERIDRGECGGGKRGKYLSKSDFIEKDVNNFSMKWFQKAKKIKKRKPKRKRKNSDSQECEQEPDSEY